MFLDLYGEGVFSMGASIVEQNWKVLQELQALFEQAGPEQEGKTWRFRVQERHEGIPLEIEVYPKTGGGFLNYRVHTSEGPGLWNSWDSPEDIVRSFIQWGLIPAE